MELSGRLKVIAGEIAYETLADIGTDHGYIPIYAVETGKVKRAFACDINAGPLKIAAKNIQNYGLTGAIEVRQGDGLGAVQPGETQTAVIAGMGGMLIIDILKKNPEVTASLSQLILQPQLDAPAIRRYVHANGFKIINEILVFEENRFYNVLNCHRGANVLYNECDYLLGKILIDRKDGTLRRFVESEIIDIEMLISSLDGQQDGQSPNIVKRKKELRDLLDVYREVMQCLCK